MLLNQLLGESSLQYLPISSIASFEGPGTTIYFPSHNFLRRREPPLEQEDEGDQELKRAFEKRQVQRAGGTRQSWSKPKNKHEGIVRSQRPSPCGPQYV